MTYYIQELHGAHTPRLLGFAANGVLKVYGWERQGGGWTIDKAVGYFRNTIKLHEAVDDYHYRPASQEEITAILLSASDISL